MAAAPCWGCRGTSGREGLCRRGQRAHPGPAAVACFPTVGGDRVAPLVAFLAWAAGNVRGDRRSRRCPSHGLQVSLSASRVRYRHGLGFRLRRTAGLTPEPQELGAAYDRSMMRFWAPDHHSFCHDPLPCAGCDLNPGELPVGGSELEHVVSLAVYSFCMKRFYYQEARPI
jgi:hypothetical protein